MSKKIGSLVYATDQGLGILAKQLYDAGVLDEVLVVKHAHYPTRLEWYPGAQVIPVKPFDPRLAREFCDRMDVLLFLETPFEWGLLSYCHERGKRTVLMPMYECMPERLSCEPDLWLCPSQVDLDYYPCGMAAGKHQSRNSVYLPVPVAGVQWQQRQRAEVFVHNAGHGGLLNRNGTGELLDALPYVQSPIKLLLRSQKRLQWDVTDPRVEVRIGTLEHDELWGSGDVFLFPEKFNGLSLPLQEALAAGMLVMAGARYPMTSWLPNDPLIPVSSYTEARISPRCHKFQQANYSPRDIAATIDAWYGKDITGYSQLGLEYAQTMCWANWRKEYRTVIEG